MNNREVHIRELLHTWIDGASMNKLLIIFAFVRAILQE